MANTAVVVTGHFDTYKPGDRLEGADMQAFLARNPAQEMYVRVSVADPAPSAAPQQSGSKE